MIIGVTGTSGAGKSKISELLKNKLEAVVVDADKIAKEMSQKQKAYYDAIVSFFGIDILRADEEINRKKLAQMVYEDSAKMQKLNELTNAYVVKEIEEKALMLEKERTVILDVPRLVESGLDNICDFTIAVLADEAVKLERICARDNVDAELAKKRLTIQPKDAFYLENVDYIIKNNGEDLEEQINEWRKICIKHGKN